LPGFLRPCDGLLQIFQSRRVKGRRRFRRLLNNGRNSRRLSRRFGFRQSRWFSAGSRGRFSRDVRGRRRRRRTGNSRKHKRHDEQNKHPVWYPHGLLLYDLKKKHYYLNDSIPDMTVFHKL
jgi:hypothetical protein